MIQATSDDPEISHRGQPPLPGRRYRGRCRRTPWPPPKTSYPDLALLDLHLARGTTGFPVAVRLSDLEVPCLFVSGKAPSFSMPDLALGCLIKPFTAEEVHRALAMAEDLLRGRETGRPLQPQNLTLYEPPRTWGRRSSRATFPRSGRCGRVSSIGFHGTRVSRAECAQSTGRLSAAADRRPAS